MQFGRSRLGTLTTSSAVRISERDVEPSPSQSISLRERYPICQSPTTTYNKGRNIRIARKRPIERFTICHLDVCPIYSCTSNQAPQAAAIDAWRPLRFSYYGSNRFTPERLVIDLAMATLAQLKIMKSDGMLVWWRLQPNAGNLHA